MCASDIEPSFTESAIGIRSTESSAGRGKFNPKLNMSVRLIRVQSDQSNSKCLTQVILRTDSYAMYILFRGIIRLSCR